MKITIKLLRPFSKVVGKNELKLDAKVSTIKDFLEILANKYPKIPWKLVVGMRNRLIHGYFDIDLAIVYKTATQDIPPLIQELERIISSK